MGQIGLGLLLARRGGGLGRLSGLLLHHLLPRLIGLSLL